MAREITGRGAMFSLTRTVPITLLRYTTAGDHSDTTGKWIPSIPTPIGIEANIQPLKFYETLMMKEAERSKEWLNVRSISEIRKATEGAAALEADTFLYQGYTYKVMSVKVYRMGVLDHYHALAARDGISAKGVNIG